MKGIWKNKSYYCFDCGKDMPHQKKYTEVEVLRCRTRFWNKKNYHSKHLYELHMIGDVYACCECGDESYMTYRRRKYIVGSLRHHIVMKILERKEREGKVRIRKRFPRKKHRYHRIR